ncbi:hypothetical protein ACFL57_05470 [Candidatus Margulisiibacteriota bacterium]
MGIKMYNTINPVAYKNIDQGKQAFNCLNVKQTLNTLNIAHAFDSVYASLTRINNPHHLLNNSNHNPLNLNDAKTIHAALHNKPSDKRTPLENLLYKEACYIKDIDTISNRNINLLITHLTGFRFQNPQISSNSTLELVRGNIHVSIEHHYLHGSHNIKIDNSKNPPETTSKVFSILYSRIKQILPEEKAEVKREYQSGPYLVINIKSLSRFKSIFYC